MPTRFLALGLVGAMLIASALPVLGGVGGASAHEGHTSCGDQGQWIAGTNQFDDGAPGSSDHGLSDAASRQGIWEGLGLPPTFWAGTVEALHLYEDFLGLFDNPGCDTGS
jgi:hypothetical protein